MLLVVKLLVIDLQYCLIYLPPPQPPTQTHPNAFHVSASENISRGVYLN